MSVWAFEQRAILRNGPGEDDSLLAYGRGGERARESEDDAEIGKTSRGKTGGRRAALCIVHLARVGELLEQKLLGHGRGVAFAAELPLGLQDRLAIDETVILLHPPLPLVGVSIVIERERQQNDSLADG